MGFAALQLHSPTLDHHLSEPVVRAQYGTSLPFRVIGSVASQCFVHTTRLLGIGDLVFIGVLGDCFSCQPMRVAHHVFFEASVMWLAPASTISRLDRRLHVYMCLHCTLRFSLPACCTSIVKESGPHHRPNNGRNQQMAPATGNPNSISTIDPHAFNKY